MGLISRIRARRNRVYLPEQPIPPFVIGPTPLPPHLEGKVPQWKVLDAEWFTADDKRVLTQAIRGLNYIAVQPDFREAVLYAIDKTSGKTIPRVYLEAESAIEVWTKMVSGDQIRTLNDEVGVLDLKVVMYGSRWSKVVGYTYLDATNVWINRKFFSTPKFVASNIAHESMHQLGFTHATQFEGSVPYQMNDIVEALWDRYCNSPTFRAVALL